MVAIDEIATAQEPLTRERGIVRRRLLIPDAIVLLVPLVGGARRADAVRHHDIAAGIELLRIQAFPPRAAAIGLGQAESIVALAGVRTFGVVTVGGLVPVPGMRRVVADAETQAPRARRLRPDADEVTLGTHAHAVPAVVPGVVVVEVVVVVGQ